MGKEICCICGNTVTGKDTGSAALADGSVLCGACTGRVRILYPKSFTWVNVYYSGDTDDDYDSDEDTRWIDPLSDLTPAAVQGALQKADAERSARRARFGGSKAYFKVDDTFRIIKKYPKGRTFITEEYAVTGTVLLGSAAAGGEIRIARRDKTFTKPISRVEVPHGNSMVTEKAPCVPEGCYGRLILNGDAPYIYPGDILAID